MRIYRVRRENLVGEKKKKKKKLSTLNQDFIPHTHCLLIKGSSRQSEHRPAFNWRASPKMRNDHPPVETYNAYVSRYLNNTYNFKRIKLWFNQPDNSNEKNPEKKTC